MKTGTSILLLALCIIASASVIPEANVQPESNDEVSASIQVIPEVNVQPESNDEVSASIQEPLQAENSMDDLPDIQERYTRSCPGGWEQYDQRCFRYIDIQRSWAEAERYCLLLGGNLASVHSFSEYYFIQGLIVTQTHSSPVAWIGASDAQMEGIWFWSDGSRFGFSHWNPGSPNNLGGSENCLQMNYGGGLSWNDWACSGSFPSVCARRL